MRIESNSRLSINQHSQGGSYFQKPSQDIKVSIYRNPTGVPKTYRHTAPKSRVSETVETAALRLLIKFCRDRPNIYGSTTQRTCSRTKTPFKHCMQALHKTKLVHHSGQVRRTRLCRKHTRGRRGYYPDTSASSQTGRHSWPRAFLSAME